MESILEYYSDEVVPALAGALIADDRFPKEALNEIRASYTHLARAQKHKDDAQDHADELNKASRHLQRVCVDCLKISVFVTARRCELAVEALTEEIQLPNDVYKEISKLRKRRRAISIHESRETTLGIIEEMKEIFNDFDKFYQSLDNQFAGKTAEERRSIRKGKKLKQNIKWAIVGFLLGILGGIISTVIYNNFIAENAAKELSAVSNPLSTE